MIFPLRTVYSTQLQRFVPAYFTTITDWLSTRIRGFGPG
jgi:hypothetical protein